MLQRATKSEASPVPSQSHRLALAPTENGVKFIMTYKQRLKPWAVARLLPTGKWAIIGRYHSRSDADGHLWVLRLRVPNMQFKVVFDLGDYPSGGTLKRNQKQ